MTTERSFLFILSRPMAASVPSTVAMTEETMATTSITKKDCMMTRSWSNSSYQRRVKPVQVFLLLLSLKEKIINTAMGAYRKAMTNQMYSEENHLLFLIRFSPPFPHRQSCS